MRVTNPGLAGMSVCVLGSINRDIVCRVERLPQAGETVAARETLLLPGGKGANQAVAAARMGVATRMIGVVGDDADGEALTQFLRGEKIDVSRVMRLPGVPTGAAYIALDDAGENQIVVAAGANARITPAAAVAAIGCGDRVFLAQQEVPIETIAALFAAARGVRMLNAAPALSGGAALFALTDILIVNQSELALYLGVTQLARTPADAAIARSLLTRPDQIAIVTLGAGGAVLVTADTLDLVPGREAQVVDTTGAGDCFCGVLAAFLDEGIPPVRALGLANAAAAICVGRAGAAPSMPIRDEVIALAGGAS